MTKHTTTPAIHGGGTRNATRRGSRPGPPRSERGPGDRRSTAGLAVAILLALTAAGCTAQQLEHGAPSMMGNRATARFLALGDSYTIGESVAPEARWPVQLAARLRVDGVVLGEPEIVARTGWTTGELDAAIDAAAPRGPYALVSLLAGVHDQFRGGDAETYVGSTHRARFRGTQFLVRKV